MSEQYCDVLVLGAGMVGSVFALRLAQLATGRLLRLHVLEQSPPPATSPADAPWTLRVSALSPGTLSVLEAMGVLADVERQRHASYPSMVVWDADGIGRVQFHAEQMGLKALGMLIENASLQSVLFAALQASDITVHCPQTWRALEQVGGQWRVTLASGDVLVADLLVAADGAQSPVRSHLQRGVTRWDYQQKAVVATVAHEIPHEFCARQRFLPTGPLAFLPTNHPQQCSIVWTLPSAQADAVVAADAQTFNQQLTEAFEGVLGAVTGMTTRAAFPLQAIHADHYAQDNVVLLGDAAHSIHPLAGQGVNLGIQDAECLANRLLQQHRAGLPWHHPRGQRQYSRERRGANATMMHAMTGFERLFAADLPALRLLRNVGMQQFDRLPWLKHRVIERALRG